MRFSNDKETEIETWTEIQLETALTSASEAMQVQAFYYLDGELLAYSPIETYRDSALHILGLHWFQLISDIMPHTWVVKLKATGGTVTINPAGVHTVIKGQGLAKQAAWDGTISVTDVVGYAYLDGLEMASISENFTAQLQTPKGINFIEVIPTEEITILEAAGVTDELNIEINYHPAVPFVGEQYTGEPITGNAII